MEVAYIVSKKSIETKTMFDRKTLFGKILAIYNMMGVNARPEDYDYFVQDNLIKYRRFLDGKGHWVWRIGNVLSISPPVKGERILDLSVELLYLSVLEQSLFYDGITEI